MAGKTTTPFKQAKHYKETHIILASQTVQDNHGMGASQDWRETQCRPASHQHLDNQLLKASHE